jgi:DNA-directed RNA polymerase specialized sigma24 family protein
LRRRRQQAAPRSSVRLPDGAEPNQKGADAGEPNALVRFAEREERSALAEADPSRRRALLLQAFTYYAAAAIRARNEAWPDETWRIWRYRRATLARLLAQEGMMQPVADAYSKVLEQKVPGGSPH